MSSVITGILSSTVSLLLNKVRGVTAMRLMDGDFTDQKIFDVVVGELNDVTSKIVALSRKDLLSSCVFYREGVDALSIALTKSNLEQKAVPNETKDDGGKTTMASAVVSDALNEVLKLRYANEMIKLVSDKEFQSAKRRFREARRNASVAFFNPGLSTEDRIFASKLRVVSNILECLDDPESAIIGCLLVLEELHQLPVVREMFDVYIKGGIKSFFRKTERVELVKSVMLINKVVFEYGLKFSSERLLLCQPTIKLSYGSFNPIFQWTEIASRMPMGMELEQQPGTVVLDEEIEPHHTAVNSRSEVIVKASDNSIKIISRTGETKTVELPDPKEFDKVTVHTVSGLAVDKNDKVYVARWCKTQTEHGGATSCALSRLDEKYDVTQTYLLDFLKLRPGGIKMVINKNNDIIISQRDDTYVYICDDIGHLKHKIETTTCQYLPTLGIGKKNEIITSCVHSQDVKIYSEEGILKPTIKLPEHHKVVSVAFHHVIGKIIALTQKDGHSYFLHAYSELGELETTAFICDDINIFNIAIISHSSGPFAVVIKKKHHVHIMLYLCSMN